MIMMDESRSSSARAAGHVRNKNRLAKSRAKARSNEARRQVG